MPTGESMTEPRNDELLLFGRWGISSEDLFTAGMGLQVGAGVYGALESRKQADTEASWYKYNAAMYMRAAQEAMAASSYTQEQLIREGKRFKGTQLARAGASGVALEGSPTKALIETAKNLERDRYMIGARGRQKAASLNAQARISLAQARTAKQRGTSSLYAALIGVGTNFAASASIGFEKGGT